MKKRGPRDGTDQLRGKEGRPRGADWRSSKDSDKTSVRMTTLAPGFSRDRHDRRAPEPPCRARGFLAKAQHRAPSSTQHGIAHRPLELGRAPPGRKALA